jgi:septal ring factor EnvC (AmiA/AmiB activator)
MLLILIFSSLFSFRAFAQLDSATSYRLSMSKEEWDRQMKECRNKKNNLIAQLASLMSSIDNLKSKLNASSANVSKSENDLFIAVGASKNDVDSYRIQFEVTERNVNTKSDTYANLKKQVAILEASKIRCLPEFFERFTSLKKNLALLAPKVEPKKGKTKSKTEAPVKRVRKKKNPQ